MNKKHKVCKALYALMDNGNCYSLIAICNFISETNGLVINQYEKRVIKDYLQHGVWGGWFQQITDDQQNICYQQIEW